ncbi:MAG: hypothetical protein ABEK12_00030, partial [Candidatus Nanohaloarchaea archaeon]
IIGTVDAGAVGSLVSIGGVVFALVAERLAEAVDRTRMIAAGAVGTGIFFALKVFVTTPVQAFAVSFGAGMVAMVYYIPLFSNLSDIADDEDVVEFFSIGAYIVVGVSSLSGLKATFIIAAGAMGIIALLAPWIEGERPAR